MTTPAPFDAVLQGLAAERESAAEAVVRENFIRLIRLLQSRIGRRFAAKVDAEAIAQSTLRTFFRQNREEPFPLTDWHEMWNLLATIAVRKCSNEIRQFQQIKRDVTREVAGSAVNRVVSGQSPEEEVLVKDLYDHLTADLGENERQVIEMSIEGYLVKEIVECTGLSKRTVLRIRKKIQSRLENRCQVE